MCVYVCVRMCGCMRVCVCVRACVSFCVCTPLSLSVCLSVSLCLLDTEERVALTGRVALSRYPILIRAIVHRTDATHADHADLLTAMEAAETWAAKINEAVRRQEDSTQLQALQK
jgi:hypothetical protein